MAAGPGAVTVGLLGLWLGLVEILTVVEYLRSQGAQLSAALGRAGRIQGWIRILLELQALVLLRTLAIASDLTRLGLLLVVAGAVVRDQLGVGLVGLAMNLVLHPPLERLAIAARRRQVRFHHFDGVLLIDSGSRDRLLVGEGLGGYGRLVGAFDRWFYPPLSQRSEGDSIEVLGARLELPAGTPCKVCGEELGEEPLVLCAACRTPHHRACFEYAGGCSTYGCGGRDAVPYRAPEPGSSD